MKCEHTEGHSCATCPKRIKPGDEVYIAIYEERAYECCSVVCQQRVESGVDEDESLIA